MSENAPNMQDRINNLSDTAGQVGSHMGDMAQQAKGKLGDLSQQGAQFAREKSQHLQKATQHYVEENPWYAVGIAVGVGVLVGMLISHRS